MTKAGLSGLAFLINLAQERDSPGGFATLHPLRVCGACGLRWKTLARFLSSAPSRVRIPERATKKRAAWTRFIT